jgi:hypothetical protein
MADLTAKRKPVSLADVKATVSDMREGAAINPYGAQLTQMDVPKSTANVQYGQTVTPQRANLMGIEDLASKFGNINYDDAKIRDVFNQATDAQYAADKAAYKRTEGQYYNKLATSQDSYLDTMRRAASASVQNGANAGMQNANQLSAMLGMSQQTSDDALKLTQDARALEDKYNADKAANAQKAMQYADTQKLAVAGVATQEQANEAQMYASDTAYNAQVQAANTQAGADVYASDNALLGTRYNADQNLIGTKYASDSNLQGTKYNADKGLEGTKYSADKNLEGTKISASATRAAAGAAASAARYAANKGYDSTVYASNTNLKIAAINKMFG